MIANNLANSNTNGYKKDLPTFKEYLTTVERNHDNVEIPRGPIKDRDLAPLDGRDQSFVVIDGTYTNFKPGSIRVTQSPLDVALDGPGFLEVSTPSGVRYSRQGSLKVATDGRLVTTDGFPVLSAQPGGLAAAQQLAQDQPGQGGLATQGGVAVDRNPAAEAARTINLRDRSGPLTITENGEIYSGEDLVAKLSVVEFNDPRKLRKAEGQSFVAMDSANFSTTPPKTIVRQGMLETSNVNPVEEMTSLIQANRLFEHDLKAMKTYGDMMGREVNDIGKL